MTIVFCNPVSINCTIYFHSLSTSHTPCLGPSQRRWYNHSILKKLRIYIESTIPQHSFQRSLLFIPSFVLHAISLSHPPCCRLRHQIRKTIYPHASNSSPFNLILIRRIFTYLKHLIILFLPIFTLTFLLSHTLPNSLTSLRNFPSSWLFVLHHCK